MKSYLLTFGKALACQSLCILHRREPVKIFNEIPNYRRNNAFPAGIQGLNYHIAQFFFGLPRNGLIFDLQLSHFTQKLRVLFCSHNRKAVNSQGND
jgi:hypothetical protein